jgi:hypothetical protein
MSTTGYDALYETLKANADSLPLRYRRGPVGKQGERTVFLKPLLGMDLDEKIGYIKKRRNPCY